MKAKRLGDAPQTFAVVLDKGDEVIGALTTFARRHRLSASHFTGIGALGAVTLGYFDRASKNYKKILLDEQVEVLSLVGHVTGESGDPKLHVHIVVGTSDGIAHGGHLLEGRVWPTLEVVLTESPASLRRRVDPETGLALIDIPAWDEDVPAREEAA